MICAKGGKWQKVGIPFDMNMSCAEPMDAGWCRGGNSGGPLNLAADPNSMAQKKIREIVEEKLIL